MTLAEAELFLANFTLEVGDSTDVEMVIAPPFTAIAKVSDLLSRNQNIKLGAQNMHPATNGAYTGEISIGMLRELYVRYVILGHSERRSIFGETDAFINEKVKAALAGQLRPILCVGETLEQRDANEVESVLERQLTGGLAGIDAEHVHDVVIAYEPVWAIGTGRTASPEQAQSAHAHIRKVLGTIAGEAVAAKIRIQYGGSVKPDNTEALMSQPDIDGALVGGASLDARSFSEIVKATARLLQ